MCARVCVCESVCAILIVHMAEAVVLFEKRRGDLGGFGGGVYSEHKAKRDFFSQAKVSQHDFLGDGISHVHAVILLSIDMLMEGKGGADSHINLIWP